MKSNAISRAAGKLAGMFRRPARRNFEAANLTRFNTPFYAQAISTNQDLRMGLDNMRRASREQAKNDGSYRKYLKMCERNIIGHQGIRLQMDVRGIDGADKWANDAIEEEWRKFSAFGNCTANRRMTMRGFLKLVVRALRTDGEVFIRRIPGFDNRFRYAFQLLDPAACPTTLNFITAEGNRVIMGVELDNWNAPVAYYFYARPPQSVLLGLEYDAVYTGDYREVDGQGFFRISAVEVNHYFEREFVDQSRGYPYGQAALQEMNLLRAYIKSELVASEAASNKFGALVNPDEKRIYSGRKNADGTSASGNEKPTMPSNPGEVMVLTGGWKFESFDPQHPGSNFAGFVKAMNRTISNGLDVAYNNFANDLESTNFSSMRGGVLDERDAWMDAQQSLIENVLLPEFYRWLEWQVMRDDFPFDFRDIDRISRARFLPRRWTWVDPEKDAKSAIYKIAVGATSPQAVAAELGTDFADNVELTGEALSRLGKVQEFLAGTDKLEKALTPAGGVAVQELADDPDKVEEGGDAQE